jgi:WD40 repeat protein
LEGHTFDVNSVAFSPDGKRVVSGSHDMTIRIWDVESGQVVVGPLEGHTSYVSSVAFSPDGKRIVSGSDDRTIRIWDVESGQVVGPLEGHTDYVSSVAFSPDGKRVVSGSYNKTIRVWNLEAVEPQYPPSFIQAHPITSSDCITNGWLTRPNHAGLQRLFWIQEHRRSGLWNTETVLIIGAPITQLNLDKFVHGKSWTRCNFLVGSYFFYIPYACFDILLY